MGCLSAGVGGGGGECHGGWSRPPGGRRAVVTGEGAADGAGGAFSVLPWV